MLSRFISTDYISAAGAAAGVPSRIGSEEASIIGETHLNGTALDSTAEGVNADNAVTGVEGTTDSAGSSLFADAYYNVGAAVLILLLLVLVIVGFVWRQRRRRHSGRGMHSFLPTSKHENGNGMSSHLHQHKRNRSSMSDRSYRQSRGQVGNDEEANELLAMEKRGGSASSVQLPRGEELFSVGEEDEEENSDEEGNIGRAGRKLSAMSDEVKGGASGSSSQRYDS